VGSGARGVIFDGAGWLLGGGSGARQNLDRAAAVAALGGELQRCEPFLAAGEPADAPGVASGYAAGAWELGERRLVLVWRDRPQDVRAVGGGIDDAAEAEVALPAAPGRVDLLDAGALTGQSVDWREPMLRLHLGPFDLTAAVAIGPRDGAHAAWLADAAHAIQADLPAAAGRALVTANSRFLKVSATIDRLVASKHSVGGAADLETAAENLLQARAALAHGYVRSALDQALEAERHCRAAQAVELDAALGKPLEGGQRETARLAFATLPYLYEAPPPEAAAPPPLPLKLDFTKLADGDIPSGWHALAGFDQTVATLTGHGGKLRWQPRGADPGVLALAFAPAATVQVEMTLTVVAPLSGSRLLLLAPSADRAPLGGLALGRDGVVTGWPQAGATARWTAGAVHRVSLKVARGRLSATFDGQPVGAAAAVREPIGALLLAKPPGEDGAPLDIAALEAR
jgi:hypothetical protein